MSIRGAGRNFVVRYALEQIVRFVALMFAVSFVVFALVSASPIDPVQMNVGQAAYMTMSEAKRAQLAQYWGVGTPLLERYANWLGSVFCREIGALRCASTPRDGSSGQPCSKLVGAFGHCVGRKRRARPAARRGRGRQSRSVARSIGEKLLLRACRDADVLARGLWPSWCFRCGWAGSLWAFRCRSENRQPM